TGATNVWRVAGRNAGLTVFALDVLKAYIPTAASHYLDNTVMAGEWNGFIPHIVPMLVAILALAGHSKSIVLNFQEGKSAATGLGALLGLNPVGALLTFATWFVVLLIWRMVSLGSIIGVSSCPFWFYLNHAPPPYICFCVFGIIFVVWRHKANIQRMLAG